ncbi:MAG: formate/nitrite transporter family protein [Eubacteriaceae bacterium]|nr:formate/nitrite transporter family protein [Eubacteriaceae bacterium]
MNGFSSPKEISEATLGAAETKAGLPVYKKLILGFLAGMYIAFGAVGFLTLTTALSGDLAGFGKFFGACVFPVGLMLVVICGAELFTGNVLMTLGVYAKRIDLAGLFGNWVFVYIGNAVGSIFAAFLVSQSGLFAAGAMNTTIVNLGIAKTTAGFLPLFCKGILCNILVDLAVWYATGAKDIAGKALACFFPIMLFVLSGYEHCVANMFYLPLAQFSGAPITGAAVWLGNILPVTLGNILGGMLVTCCYYFAYVRQSK